MKRLNKFVPSAAMILLAGLALSVSAQSQPPPGHPHTTSSIPTPQSCVDCKATLSGAQSSAGQDDGAGVRNNVVFAGKAAGTLPGTFSAAINYRTSDNTIVGGAWVLTVTEADNNELGRLIGKVIGGTVKLNPDGTMASVAAALEIGNGAKKYAMVHVGNGNLALTLEQGDALPQVVGTQSTLTLNF